MRVWRFKLENLIKGDYTIATDQIIRYPAVANASRYTFSLWAFPEETYPTRTRATFFSSARTTINSTGYRVNMLYVGYRVAQDQSSLLSYSYDGNVMTMDPVSTGNPGWTTFLGAYNQFCSDNGGHSAFQSDFRRHTGAGAEGSGRTLAGFRGSAQDLRPQRPFAQQLLP